MLSRLKDYYYQINPRFRAYLPVLPACLLVAAAWALYDVHRAPATYVSTGRIVVSGRMNLPEGNAFSEELANFLGTQVEILASDELAARARQQLLVQRPDLAGSASVRVTPLRGTSILLVQASGGNGDYTTQFLDALLQQYIESRRDRRIETTVSAMKQIQEEIPRVERQLAQQEEELFRFKERHNMGFVGRQSADSGQLLSQLKLREANLRMQLNLAEAMQQRAVVQDRENRLSALGGIGAAQPGPAAPEAKESEQLAALRQQLIKLQVERDQAGAVFKPRHPRMQRLEQEIQKQTRLIELLTQESERAYAQTVDGMRSELNSVLQAIADWEKKALESTRAEAEYEKLQSALTRTRELYSRLVNGLQSIDVSKGVSVDIVQILQRATPAQLQRPSPMQAVKRGVMLGLLGGAALLFGLAKLDQRAYSPAEIGAAVKAVPLVEIPHVPGGRLGVDTAANHRLQPLNEAMRKLAAGLGIGNRSAADARVIFCVSTTPSEGKSTVAQHLAMHVARSGLRTLLIDADLRRGHLAETLGFPAQLPGLADAIDGTVARWQDVVVARPDSAVKLLGRGTPGPQTVDRLAGWFDEARLAEFKQEYDVIVIDAAPLAPVADSLRFLNLVDRVLMVTRIKTTHLPLAGRIAAVIRQHRQRDFNLVINGVREEHHAYGYYQANYGYY